MRDAVNARPRGWRRFLTLSLRALVVLVLALGGVMGWLANRANVQRAAVAEIEKSGAKVWYDWEWSNGLATGASLAWPEWLVRLVGHDYFGRVVAVSLTSRASDADLVQVGRFERLERLDVHASAVTSAGLAALKHLRRLQSLQLVRTRIDDAGVAQLEGFRNLRMLSLSGSGVTDQGLSHLAGLTQLEDLDLSATAVGDAGLAVLRNVTRLKTLDLSRTHVGDAGVVHVASFPAFKISSSSGRR